MDLIDRETAYKVLTKYYHHSTDIQHEALREALSRVPSAEKTGRWETFFPLSRPRCSVCGELCIGTHAFDYTLTDYCPNCGARMVKQDVE